MSKITKLTIKIKGNWNTKIFQPNWLIPNVLESPGTKNRELGLLLNLEEREFGFIFEEVEILPTENRLEFVIHEKNTEKIEIIKNATKYATKIIKLLPHTPISSVNFNILYSLDAHHKFEKLFGKDFGFIDNYELKEYKLTNKNELYQSNIVVSLSSDNKIKVEFNFVYDRIKDFKEDIFLKHIEETKKLL